MRAKNIDDWIAESELDGVDEELSEETCLDVRRALCVPFREEHRI